jgi:hypothetical protein
VAQAWTRLSHLNKYVIDAIFILKSGGISLESGSFAFIIMACALTDHLITDAYRYWGSIVEWAWMDVVEQRESVFGVARDFPFGFHLDNRMNNRRQYASYKSFGEHIIYCLNGNVCSIPMSHYAPLTNMSRRLALPPRTKSSST